MDQRWVCHAGKRLADRTRRERSVAPGDPARADAKVGGCAQRFCWSTIGAEQVSAEIRRITEKDIPSYHACLDVVARERCYLVFLAAPPLEQSRAWIFPHIQQNHPYFVATVGERVVGWCDITPLEREGFTHRGTLGMGVHPDFRRQGIGARLLRAALAHAEKMGLERVELEVFASNQPARRLYESFGFVVEGTLRRARKLDGQYDDLVLMALLMPRRIDRAPTASK